MAGDHRVADGDAVTGDRLRQLLQVRLAGHGQLCLCDAAKARPRPHLRRHATDDRTDDEPGRQDHEREQHPAPALEVRHVVRARGDLPTDDGEDGAEDAGEEGDGECAHQRTFTMRSPMK